jgi:hypothetical protein
MDTNMIILILAGLVALGLIYRSVSSKPEKTTGGGRPTNPSQPDLVNLSKAQLIDTAETKGIVVRKSWSKSRIMTEIETHLK